MKVLLQPVIAALAQRRSTAINAAVGFSTFAIGDLLSQSVSVRPRVLNEPLRRGVQRQQEAEQSWRRTFIGELRQRTSEVDLGRSAKVGLLGILLNGFALGAWYRVLDRCIGSDRTRIQQVLKKCVVDQFVYAPFSITAFVGYAAVLNGGGSANVIATTKASLAEHGLETWIMDWKVWPAANIVMFRFIPSSYRPSFASVVQVAWQAYMSSVSYDSPHHYHHGNQPSLVDAIKADGGGGGGVSVRGGGEGAGAGRRATAAAAAAAAAASNGEDGVRAGVGGGGVVPTIPELPAGSASSAAAAGGATAAIQRSMIMDRRRTGRYAYGSTSVPVTATFAGGGGDGGGNDGVRAVAETNLSPPSSASPPPSKVKDE